MSADHVAPGAQALSEALPLPLGFGLVDVFGVEAGAVAIQNADLPLAQHAGEPAADGMFHLDPEVFDWRDYLARYPDLRAAGLHTEQDAIVHWLTYGIAERRQGSPGFNVQAYLDANPDVKAATGDVALAGIEHFIRHGRAEGRYRGAFDQTPAVATDTPPVVTPAEPTPTTTPTQPTAPVQVTAVPSDGVRIGNEAVQLGIAARTGGAINSLVHDGREYINDFDHGRQLQVAWQMNLGGEGNNPTEGGSAADGVGASSSSQVLGVAATATSLTVTSQPAWWLQAGDVVPASGAAATNGGATSAVTNQVLTKSVEVGVELGGVMHPNIIKHDASVTFPDGAQFVALEMPTGYLQGDFSAHYFYDIDTGALLPREPIDSRPDAQGHMETEYSHDVVGPRHRPDPIILSTPDGAHAMAIVLPHPMPPGFEDQLLARLSFPSDDPAQATQKWTALLTASNVPPGGTLSATAYIIVGTLEEVQRDLAQFYATPPS